MNRFFRSALFPLFVIVLLVYLASQTLIPHGKNSQKVTYSEFRQDIKTGQVQSAEFNPGKRQITGKLTDQKTFSVHYPSDQSVPI
ncbi:MAG TPA: ATP-dependent metallopeptidase FtsH/Yme1/Tma family protein, partial [Gaiellaceae bacterium]